MSPPKKGAAPLRDAAPEENLTDASKIVSCKPTCKKIFPDWPADVAAPKPLRGDSKKDGKDAPPAGYAFADTREGEAKKLVPIVEHPSMGLPEPERLTPERIALRIAFEAIRWTKGKSGRLDAFASVFGIDRRPVVEQAKSAGCGERSFYRNVKELRALVEVWRVELESGGE
jgi:hypothetical protein